MPAPATRSEILDRVRAILRDDLKLGADAVIEPDMPLVGGDHDLDSLDVLMVVTSVERSFGIRIPNESVGEQAFTTVGSLVDFIAEHVEAGAGS